MFRALPFVFALAACQSTGGVVYEDTTTPIVLTGATILTQNAQRPIANTMAFLPTGRIIGVSETRADGTFTEVDLSGKTVVPGFIDSHVHVRELGMDASKVDLVGVRTVDDMIARLLANPALNRGEWLVGQGWDEGTFGSIGYPDRAKLDAAFPDTPIYLESLHGFAAFVNGAALRRAGIDADTPDPDGGTILRRDTGEPTGTLLTLAQGLVSDRVPKPSARQRELAILAGLDTMARAGVTSIHEAGMTPEDVAAFAALAEAGQLPIRVYGMLDGNDEALMNAWFARGIADDPDDHFDVRAIKVFYDGSLGSRTALMAEPYSDEPDAARPTERISPSAMTKLANRAASGGFQMAVHAIGDDANRKTLDIYESALGTDAKAARWRIEHAQVLLPEDFDRFARLGVMASMQPSHAVGDSKWAEDRVGADRIRNAYAWRSLQEAGAAVVFNSDLPGEPWTPMETLYFAVNRKPIGSPGSGWYVEEALDVDQSLQAMTLGNARAAFQEDNLGSLEVGKWADFVVLSADPRAVAPDTIADIVVEQVWVAGQRIH